jgi:FdhD protein
MGETVNIYTLRITDGRIASTEDTIAREYSLRVMLNNQTIVTLLCTPRDLEWLAAGYLLSEGLIHSKADITSIFLKEDEGTINVIASPVEDAETDITLSHCIASSGWRGSRLHNIDVDSLKVVSDIKVDVQNVYRMMDDFQNRSQIFKQTGGVHSAALCNTEDIQLFCEDLGRHNAIDKVFGGCLFESIPLDEKIIMTSGRVSSEILLKVASRYTGILISKSAPTDVAVRLANQIGITLIGFVRGRKMNIYAGSQRVITP